jgi:hypothetical protein
MPLLGMLGAGALSGLGSLGGSYLQSQAAQQAAQIQLQIYNQNKGLATPFIQQGQSASNLLGNYLGANGTQAQSRAMAGYQTSPFFQQMVNTAAQNTGNQYSAAGAGPSGNYLNALYAQNAGLWQNQYNTTLAQLAGLSGQGISSLGALTGAGVGTGQQVGQSTLAAGSALGSGVAGLANAGGNALNNYSIWSLLGNNSGGVPGGQAVSASPIYYGSGAA